MQRANDIMWVHLVRLVSIFAVLWVHSSAEIFFYDAPFGGFNWWVANIYDSFARLCVPLLFMISGYLLLGKSEPVSRFFKRRALKVILPLLAWSVLFILWIHFQEYAHPSKASSMTPEQLKTLHDAGWGALLAIVKGPVYYHLWFLYVILILYLFTPLLRKVVQGTTRNALWTLTWSAAAISIASGILSPSFGAFRTGILVPGFLLSCVSYFVLGHLLGTMTISRRVFHSMWGGLLLSAAITIIGTYYATAAKGGELDQAMWLTPMPNVIAMSVAAFVMLRAIGERSVQLQKLRVAEWLQRLSNAGFGVYLIHVFFLYAFAEGMLGFTLTSVSGNPIVFVPIVAVSAFVISYACIRLMQRIPVLRQIVP